MLQKNWVTVKEAADIIGCTVQHVRYLARENQISSDKIGEKLVIVQRQSAEKYANCKKNVGRPRINPKN